MFGSNDQSDDANIMRYIRTVEQKLEALAEALQYVDRPCCDSVGCRKFVYTKYTPTKPIQPYVDPASAINGVRGDIGNLRKDIAEIKADIDAGKKKIK